MQYYYATSAQDDNTGKLRVVLHEIPKNKCRLPDIVLHKLCQRSHTFVCVYTFAHFLKFCDPWK